MANTCWSILRSSFTHLRDQSESTKQTGRDWARGRTQSQKWGRGAGRGSDVTLRTHREERILPKWSLESEGQAPGALWLVTLSDWSRKWAKELRRIFRHVSVCHDRCLLMQKLIAGLQMSSQMSSTHYTTTEVFSVVIRSQIYLLFVPSWAVTWWQRSEGGGDQSLSVVREKWLCWIWSFLSPWRLQGYVDFQFL